jgi:hypothetical protein
MVPPLSLRAELYLRIRLIAGAPELGEKVHENLDRAPRFSARRIRGRIRARLAGFSLR